MDNMKIIRSRELAKESRNDDRGLPVVPPGVSLMFKSVNGCEIKERTENRASNK